VGMLNLIGMRCHFLLFDDDDGEDNEDSHLNGENNTNAIHVASTADYAFISDMVSEIVENAMNYPLMCPAVKKYEVDFTKLITFANVIVFPVSDMSDGFVC
jgi:hypothetical protein